MGNLNRQAQNCKSLDELLLFLSALTCNCNNCIGCDIDMSALPLFSKNAPEETTGMWSYDDTHMIIGNRATEYMIVERNYFDD